MSESREVVHSLYRFFDDTDTLLYVGRTVDVRRRWREHERDKDWFAKVARVTRHVYPDAEALASAEREAIKKERPLHNVAHNAKAKLAAPRPNWNSVDDFFISRQMNLQGDNVEFPDPCDNPYVESDCECVPCHLLRWGFLGRVEDDYDDDPTMVRRITQLREDYAAGRPLNHWLDYGLFDLRLIRTFELSEFAKRQPAPALAHVNDDGLHAGCPFCHDVHSHFLRSGQVISGLFEAGCGWGHYTPYLDMDDFYNAWFEWVELNERRSAALAERRPA